MKHFYSLLVTMLLLIVGMPSASAQYRQGDEPLTTVTAGQKVLLQSAREAAMPTAYLKWAETAGETSDDFFTSKVDDTSIMQFVAATGGSFYLYNPAKQAYLEDAAYNFLTDYKIHWTTDVSKAVLLDPVGGYEAADMYTPAMLLTNTSVDFGTLYLAPIGFMPGCAGYMTNLFAGHEYYNAWVLYEVVEEAGKAALQSLIEQTFPAGVNEDNWVIGDAPGCISATAYDNLKTAFDNATAALTSTTVTDAECDALASALREAYNQAMDAIVPITPGYYFVRNYITDAYIYGHDDRVDNTYVTKAHWANYTLPETYDESAAPYIWKLELNEAGTDYYFYSPYFEKYITRAGSYGMATPLQAVKSEAGYFAVKYQDASYAQVGGYFNVLNSYFGGRILRAITTDSSVGYSSSSTDPKDDDALWSFTPVPEAFVTAMEEAKAGATLLNSLNELVTESNTLLDKTKVYDSPVTINGVIDTPGLIAEVTTNAQEQTEGDVVYAYDGMVSTFFHTAWSDESQQPEGYHDMQITLSEPVEELALKIVKRLNADATAPSSLHNPLQFVVFAKNGETEDSVGTYRTLYNQGFLTSAESTELVSNTVSVNYIKLPYATSSLRIEVRTTEANTTGHPFFCLSEIGAYSATYNAEMSAYENIPADVRESFLSALAAAEGELNAGAATQATYDALLEAYNDMNDHFADRNELRALLEDARTFQTEAVEDDAELGYYKTGSTAVFGAALDAIETRIDNLNNPTTEEFNQVKSDIESALSDFDQQLNKPAGNMLYFVSSASAQGENYGCYVYTSSNDEEMASLSVSDVPNPADYLSYMWRIEPQDDGTFFFRNAANAMYLGGVKENSDMITSTYDPVPLRIVSGRMAGVLSIQMADGKNFYALDFRQGITLREGTKGYDGAAFEFYPADFQGAHTVRPAYTMKIVTLPFAIVGHVDGATAYSLVGKTTTTDGTYAQLAAYAESDIIPAATPFIIQPEEDIENLIYYTAEESDGMNIEYVLTPGTSMGLVGTLASTTILPPFGVLRSGKIDAALEGGQLIDANSGYFDVTTLEETTVVGDIQLPITDAATSISQIVIAPSATSVYDLQGRRVMHLQKGGIYIIGGKKVIVK